ncbi:MAG: CBS domain-containing protein [Bacillota bacterium]|nr:CBS domain-containing protein [Bacillota bacterium]
MIKIEFSERQLKIIEIVKKHEPITGENIASILNLTRGTLRPDLAILTMLNILEAKPKIGYFYNKNSNELGKREISKTKAKDLKSLPVVVTKKTRIYDAAVTMFVENVGTIFVVEEGNLVGVISRKDLLKASLGGGNPADIPVGVVMTRMPKLIYCHDDENLADILRKIVENEIDCLPVVEEKSDGLKVTGRISKTNIVSYFYNTIL